MSRLPEARSPRRLLVGLLAALAAAASAGTIAAVSTLPARDGASAPSRVDDRYQIRCWQFGRLLFEENGITLTAAGARYALKLTATDRNGRPLYVAETDNATCLIRPAPEASGRWLPETTPAR